LPTGGSGLASDVGALAAKTTRVDGAKDAGPAAARLAHAATSHAQAESTTTRART